MGRKADVDAGIVRSEEELAIEHREVEAGRMRVRKTVEEERIERLVPRETEHAEVERLAVADGDSGEIETLPDGSVSIPVFEEELVITKRLVVRERILIRKRTVVEDHLIEADLRKERVDLDIDDDVSDRVQIDRTRAD